MYKNRVFYTYFIYFICMALFCVVRILSEIGVFESIKSVELRSFVTTFIIQMGIMFLIPLLLCFVFFKKTPKQVILHNEYKKIGLKAIIICFILGILIYFLNVAISAVSNGIIEGFGYRNYGVFVKSSLGPWSLFFYNLLVVAILPAFFEEFLHRGILLQGIRRIGYGKAILISGILFGLIHFSITQMVYATIIGIIMAFIVITSRSIIPAIIIHLTNNAITVYLSSAKTNGWFAGNLMENISKFLVSSNPYLTFVAIFSFLAVLCTIIVYLIYVLYKLSNRKHIDREIKSKYKDISELKLNKNAFCYEETKQIQEIQETSVTLNLYSPPIESPLATMIPKQPEIYKSNFKDNIFLYGSLLLGFLVTIFTLIWGLV